MSKTEATLWLKYATKINQRLQNNTDSHFPQVICLLNGKLFGLFVSMSHLRERWTMVGDALCPLRTRTLRAHVATLQEGRLNDNATWHFSRVMLVTTVIQVFRRF